MSHGSPSRRRRKTLFSPERSFTPLSPFFFAVLILDAKYLFSVGVPKLTLCVRRVTRLQGDTASQANSGAHLFIGDVERNGKQKLDDRCTHVKNQV